MRKIQAIGNVTRDAEIKQFDGGRSVINFDIACNEKFKDRNGQKVEKVFYIQCAVWRESTTIAQYITKGTKIYVEGQPDVNVYINKEGKAAGSIRINVREMEFLGGGKNQQQSSGNQSGHQDARDTGFGNETLVPTPDDDLPF